MESSDTLNLQQKAENALDRVKRNDTGTGRVPQVRAVVFGANLGGDFTSVDFACTLRVVTRGLPIRAQEYHRFQGVS